MNSNTPIRRPRNWEVLQALESIDPPSPSPSYGSDFLASLSSMGEIPIILDPGICEGQEDDLQDSLLNGYRPALMPTSLSNGTVGTFGPLRPLSNGCGISANTQGYRDSTGTLPLSPITPTRYSQLLAPSLSTSNNHKRPTDNSLLAASAYLSRSNIHISSPPAVHSGILAAPSHSSEISSAASVSTPRSPNFGFDPYPSFLDDSVSTIAFAPGGSGLASPSARIELTTEAQDYALKHRWSQYRDKNLPPSTYSPSEQQFSGSLASANRSPSPIRVVLASNVHGVREGPLPRTRSTKSSGSGQSIRSTSSGQTAHGPLPFPELSYSVPNLPGVLSWLANLVLELCIDQEGFRLIRPQFRLSEYSSPHTDDGAVDLVSALTFGTAEFCPLERQSFVFHHATLDSTPVLRKLTMASDDSRDYISRQASLIIKSNGVYSVSAAETFDTGPPSPRSSTHGVPPSHNDPLKLTWRFEYTVEDRRSDGSVIAKQGEKTLTPLSFSCSPGLLHPTHGKKIRLMQVMKKSLTPKLASAKVLSEAQSPDFLAPPSPQQEPILLLNGTKAMHRRAHSSSVGISYENEDRDRALSEGPRIGLKKHRTVSLMMHSPHRTSEEQPLLPARVPSPKLFRHIVPPTELAVLLEARTDLNAIPIATPSLKPATRHRHGLLLE